MKQTRLNDFKAAARAKRHGMHHALKIAQEARKAGIPYDLAYAVVEQETGTGRNVFGHDVVPNPAPKGARVTRSRYLTYKRARKAGLGMQGVGLTQLTWWELQDEADRHGGCWKPRTQLRVAFRHLRGLLKEHGVPEGLERYNGAGVLAQAYSVSVRERRHKWHRRINPKG